MATKTTAKKAPAKAAKPAAAKSAAPVKPLGESLSKSGLIAHIAAQANVEAKAVKAVLAGLESAVLASVHKKGVGQFTLPGLFKIYAVKVAAKPKRKGKNRPGSVNWPTPSLCTEASTADSRPRSEEHTS